MLEAMGVDTAKGRLYRPARVSDSALEVDPEVPVLDSLGTDDRGDDTL